MNAMKDYIRRWEPPDEELRHNIARSLADYGALESFAQSLGVMEALPTIESCPRCYKDTVYFGLEVRCESDWAAVRTYVEWCPHCTRVVDFSPRGDLHSFDPWPDDQTMGLDRR